MSTSVPKHAPGRVAHSTEIRAAVFHDAPLRNELYRTLYESKLSAEEVAFQLGISPSYLRRAVLTTESGVRFPADLVGKLMRVCGDYRALALLAAECDHIAVSLPKIRRGKKNAAEAVNNAAANFHALIGDMLAFFARPTAPAAAAIRARVRNHLAEMAAIEWAVRDFQQLDLEMTA
jgi:hypothetical protein